MKWTEDHDAQLERLAEDGLTAAQIGQLMGRSESAVYGRAARIGVSFDSTNQRALQAFLGEGGALIREDIGGLVGVRWAPAHRSGRGFPTPVCERLLELGLLAQPDPTRPIYAKAQP